MAIHCNYNIEKSYFLIEGKFDLNFYNKKNKFLSNFKLDEKKNFFYRFKKKINHNFKITSNYIIFLETSLGPFKGMKKL